VAVIRTGELQLRPVMMKHTIASGDVGGSDRQCKSRRGRRSHRYDASSAGHIGDAVGADLVLLAPASKIAFFQICSSKRDVLLLLRRRAQAVPGVAHLMKVRFPQIVRRVELQSLDVEPADRAEHIRNWRSGILLIVVRRETIWYHQPQKTP
jgi:hypothetical protein